MIELKIHFDTKRIPENKNPNKIIKIIEKFLNFNKTQKAKRHSLGRAMVSDHKVSDRNHIKISTPKQMLQRLPIVLAQVNAGNISENLLNEIRQIIYSLYRAKEITKIVYNNIMNSTKL